MSTKNRGDNFDYRKEYETRIAPAIKEACIQAGALRMPYVILFAVKNNTETGETQYVTQCNLASTNRDLDVDFVRTSMLAGLGCVNTAPKRVMDAFAAVEGAKTLMTEKEQKAAETLGRLIRPTRWLKDAVRTLAGFAERCPKHLRQEASIVAHYCKAMLGLDFARQDMPALADDMLTPIAKCIVAGHDMAIPREITEEGEGGTLWDD